MEKIGESEICQKWQLLESHLLHDSSHPLSRTQVVGQLSKLWHLLK